MTIQHKQEVTAMLKEQMDRKELSTNMASTLIGFSPAVLSNMLNHKWTNISNKMWMKAANWVQFKTGKWKIRETANLKRITNLCEDAKEYSRMVAVSGPTGLGKSTALKLYGGEKPNTYYLLVTFAMTQNDFVNELMRTVGLDEGGNVHRRLSAIINKLSEMSDPLLIIDDCGKLRDSCIKLIQIIYDSLEGNCGIVLSGTEAFKNYIYRCASIDKIGFRELKRRIGYWQPLSGVTLGFIKAAASDFGIDQEDAINYIKSVCKDYGSLRELLINYDRYVAAYHPKDLSQREILAGINYGDAMAV